MDTLPLRKKRKSMPHGVDNVNMAAYNMFTM